MTVLPVANLGEGAAGPPAAGVAGPHQWLTIYLRAIDLCDAVYDCKYYNIKYIVLPFKGSSTVATKFRLTSYYSE
jgi:hypothetical protein